MKHFRRVLCALTLCTGFVLLSCEKTNQESGEDAKNSQDDVQNNQEKPVVFPLATDLSSSASANCYIISVPGFYKFKTVRQ